MDLQPLEYEILDYVAAHSPISEKELIKHFESRIDSMPLRLNQMTKRLLNESLPPSVISHPYRYKANVLIINKGTITISDYGRKVLQDHINQTKHLQKQKTEERLWRIIPIVTSLVALLKSFWPELTSLWKQLMQ